MKMWKKMKRRGSYLLVALGAMLFSSMAMAVGSQQNQVETGGDVDIAEVGELAGMLQAWMGGDLGMLITMVGLLVAIIMVVARASLMPVLFVLGLAIILGWGPALFGSILTMEVAPAMLAAL